ncbi:MAG: helix-hairpin-helix domain-containing protein [Planctomycetota bacterium]|jgi:DNA uptake protein ComE-like DNA-binding protein
MTATMVKEYTFTPQGVKVTILSTHDDGEYMMVRSVTTGKVFYAHKGQIRIEEVEAEEPLKVTRKRRGRQVIRQEMPAALTRININSATPELLCQMLEGIGMKTAKEIKELQQSMPGERFSKLEQLKSIKNVDWEEVLKGDVAYVE